MARSLSRTLPTLIPSLLLLPLLATPVVADEAPPELLGECSVDDLRAEPYAEWFEHQQAEYTPNAEVLEALRTADLDELELEIFFGTWCGDSRREVPRMLELLDTLGHSEAARRLIAVDRSDALHKRSPGGEEEGLEIYRVPTIRVLHGGEEIGRIVEHPALSLERDLLAIVTGAGYRASYYSYPVVRRWLAEGLLSDPNINADGLAARIRSMVSSEWELYSTARVLGSRGDVDEAAKLMEVNCALYWESASCHHRLAEAQARAGQLTAARRSTVRALERNDDPERVEALVELIDRTAGATSSADFDTLEVELRAAEQGFADAFARGDMDAFADFVAEGAVFFAGSRHLRGKETIVTTWRGWRGDEDEPPFTWEPERVSVDAGGGHGQSTGPVYRDGQWVSSFASTWRHTPDGWKVLLDVGPRCPPPLEAGDSTN